MTPSWAGMKQRDQSIYSQGCVHSYSETPSNRVWRFVVVGTAHKRSNSHIYFFGNHHSYTQTTISLKKDERSKDQSYWFSFSIAQTLYIGKKLSQVKCGSLLVDWGHFVGCLSICTICKILPLCTLQKIVKQNFQWSRRGKHRLDEKNVFYHWKTNDLLWKMLRSL